jgi:hypothetical protein
MRFGKLKVVILTTAFIITAVFVVSFVGALFTQNQRFESASAEFTPPHFSFSSDEDQDGFKDTLTLNVSVTTYSYVNLSILGHLYYYEQGEPETTISYGGTFAENSSLTFNAGNYVVKLRFDTYIIQRSDREDGAWYVDLAMIDDDIGDLIDTDTYATANLTYSNFQVPPVTLEPPFTDYGIDNDTDGTYDWIIVNVSLVINEEGNYLFVGSIFNGNWSDTLDTVHFETHLDDVTIIQLWFNITAHSGEIGPYDTVIGVRGSTLTYDEILYTISISDFNYL